MFTRPKHIIYSSDSKAEQKLFICITVAAEATGAQCAVCLGRPHLPWKVWSDGETKAQSKSVIWLHLCSGSFPQLETHLGFTVATWARGFWAASKLLRMCEAMETIAAGPEKYIILLSGIWMMRVPRSSGVSLRWVDPKGLEITAFNINGPSFQYSFKVFEVSLSYHNG